MSRTRDWLKFGGLAAVTLTLAVLFLTVIDVPGRMLAQQPPPTVVANRPAPVQAPPPAMDLSNAFSAAAEAVRPSVVYIQAEQSHARVSRQQNQQQHPDLPPPFDQFFRIPDQTQRIPIEGSGSGFILSPDGYILTNNHVVDGFDRLTVQLFDHREFKATVVGRDANTDVAVIKIDAKNLPAVSLGDSDSLRVGEWVLAIGNPLGSEFSFTVTAGIVSGRGRGLAGLQNSDWNIQDFIQTDAAINPGNSGGPLVNLRGQVVGMNSAIASRTGYYSGYSFAIPIDLVRTVASQLINSGHVERAALGVRVSQATQEDAEYVGLKDIRGVTVQDFANANSPAEQAGMQPGDVIVAVNGKPIDYVAQLQQIVGFMKPGDRVQVTVMRHGGVQKTLTVRLIEAQTDETQTVAAADENAPESGSPEALLGLSFEAMGAQTAQNARIRAADRGLVVTSVDPDGPAREKGILPSGVQSGSFDVVTHVDGEQVRTMSDMAHALKGIKAGDIVSLRILMVRTDDNGQAQTQTRVVRLRAGGE